MTATCIPPYASPPLHDSEPWNNTGNQLRPLQLQECKTLSDAPSADPHCPVNAQGLALQLCTGTALGQPLSPASTAVCTPGQTVLAPEEHAKQQLHLGADQAQSSITGLYHTHL